MGFDPSWEDFLQSVMSVGTVSRYALRRWMRGTFSLAMVPITSSGGVPKSSVMMENW